MNFQITFVFLLLIPFCKAFSQEFTYFHKIENITANAKLASVLYKKLDSVKQTRRPNDSRINILFDRDVDFGYKHKRINIVFNSIYYVVNLLVKNDSIYLSSVSFDREFYDKAYGNLNKFRIDTSTCLYYLKLRNGFYKSTKTIIDLKDDLNLNEEYAYRCGDAMQKTDEWIHLEKLAKKKDIGKLTNMLQSICCEEQAYGTAGFNELNKNSIKIPKNIQKIIKHIKDRKSTLVVCNGYFTQVSPPLNQ